MQSAVGIVAVALQVMRLAWYALRLGSYGIMIAGDFAAKLSDLILAPDLADELAFRRTHIRMSDEQYNQLKKNKSK